MRGGVLQTHLTFMGCGSMACIIQSSWNSLELEFLTTRWSQLQVTCRVGCYSTTIKSHDNQLVSRQGYPTNLLKLKTPERCPSG